LHQKMEVQFNLKAILTINKRTQIVKQTTHQKKGDQ